MAAAADGLMFLMPMPQIEAILIQMGIRENPEIQSKAAGHLTSEYEEHQHLVSKC